MDACRPEPAHLSLRVPAGIAGVSAVQQALQQLAAAHALSRRTAYRLELVLEELMMNAGLHGQARALEVSVTVRAGAVVVELRDDGRAFDPGALGGPVAPGASDAPATGGRGLLLVRKSVLEWTCHATPEGNLQRLLLARES